MSNLRHYITETDGTVPGINGCPFDMDRLQRDYSSGSITPTKIINFGATAADGAMSTNTSIDLEPLGIANGEQILDVVACSGFFESSTLNFRVPNLQKPGAARASDVYVAIPDNIVVPRLVQKLHQGAIDRIIISSLAFVDTTSNGDKPRIVQSAAFESCFIKYVDPFSYGALTVFSFSYVKVKITQVDYKQISAGGTQTQSGSYVYEFDYTAGSGKVGSIG